VVKFITLHQIAFRDNNLVGLRLKELKEKKILVRMAFAWKIECSPTEAGRLNVYGNKCSFK
jgi:hypothetical protein